MTPDELTSETTKPRDARLLIASTPGQHRRPGDPDPAADFRVRHPLSSEQNDPGALRHPSTRRRAPQHRSQLRLITGTQHNRRSNRHTPLSRTPTVKSLTTRDTSAPASDVAQSRLRGRYATGEIDDEEYERRLSALTYWH